MAHPNIDHDLLGRIIAPIASQPVEYCVMIYLTDPERLVGLRHIRGDESGMDIPVRLIVADALAMDADRVVMAHNHPSGDGAASEADIAVTRRLATTLERVGVTLLDHLVVTVGGRTSLRKLGYL